MDPDPNVRPTGDKILTLDETLDFIDSQNRPVYLNYCDCRSLKGDCGMPTKTCITYKDGVNTFAHRGLSEEIDKEKAKKMEYAIAVMIAVICLGDRKEETAVAFGLKQSTLSKLIKTNV